MQANHMAALVRKASTLPRKAYALPRADMVCNIERIVIDATPGLLKSLQFQGSMGSDFRDPGSRSKFSLSILLAYIIYLSEWETIPLRSLTLACVTSASLSSYMDCISAVLGSHPCLELTELVLDLSCMKRSRMSIDLLQDQMVSEYCSDIEDMLLPLTNVRSVTVVAPRKARYHPRMLRIMLGNLFPKLLNNGKLLVECCIGESLQEV